MGQFPRGTLGIITDVRRRRQVLRKYKLIPVFIITVIPIVILTSCVSESQGLKKLSYYERITSTHLSNEKKIQWPNNEEEFHINLFHRLKYLTYGNGSLWVSDPEDTDSIYRIDPKTGEVQDQLKSKLGGGILHDGQYLWVASYSTPNILKINTDTKEVVKKIRNVGSKQAGLAFDGVNLWTVSKETGKIHQISPETGEEKSSISYPGNYPRGLIWYQGYLYHSDSLEDTIYQLDPETGGIVSRIASPSNSPRGLAFDGERLWYSDSYDGIRTLRIEYDEERGIVKSNPFYMKVKLTTRLREGVPTGAYWAVPREDEGYELIQLDYDPNPDEYVYDEFGQRVAYFGFDKIENEYPEVSVTVLEKIWHINYNIRLDQVGSLESIPKQIKNKYLKDAWFLDIKHPTIVEASREAVGEERNPYLIAVKIHDYVAQQMKYKSPQPVDWNAVALLEEGLGDCDCYTIIFMALSRAAGLPSRMVRGEHYWEDSEEPGVHWWSEAYIPNYGWVPFDPTRDDRKHLRHRNIGFAGPEIVFNKNGGTDRRYLGSVGSFSWRTDGTRKIEWERKGYHPLFVEDFSIDDVENIKGKSKVHISWMNPIFIPLNEVRVKYKQKNHPYSRRDGRTVFIDENPELGENYRIVDFLNDKSSLHYSLFIKTEGDVWERIDIGNE